MGSKKSNSTSATNTHTTDNSAVAGNNATALAAGASYTNWYQSDDDFAASYSDRSTTTSNSGNTWSDTSTRVQANDSRSWYALDNSDNSTSLQANDSRSWYALDSSDRSVTASDDRSWWSMASDSRDLSTSTSTSNSNNSSFVSYTGTDPGVLAFGEQAAQLMGAVNESQTDAVKFMTASSADLMRGMGGSVSNMFDRAGINNVQSWGQTTAAAERLLSGTADRLGAAWADTMDRSADLMGAVTKNAATTTNAAIAAYQPPAAQQSTTARYALLAVGGLVALVVLPRLLKA